MKYRIKEYQYYDGSRFQVQAKLFNLFWVDCGPMQYPARFDTLEEASEYIAREQHNDKVKPIIHET